MEQMRSELHSYVEHWASDFAEEETELSLSWQAALAPVCVDGGVVCDGYDNPYLIDPATGLAVQVDWSDMEKELHYQIDHASNGQVKRYHDWVSAMIARG